MIQKGIVLVEEIPAPLIEPGTVLVRVDHSCISVGTEMSGIRAASVPLWRRAFREPQSVKAVLEMAATEGFSKTRAAVQGVLSAGVPTGYSAAGKVIETADDVKDLRPGDRVACAGAQCAHHAEVIRVPRNLTVIVPDGLDFKKASTVTLGAIALQGVRRASPTMGECFVVVGLGILGQLTVQLLHANGCKVIGIDLDPSRVRRAMDMGMAAALDPGKGDSYKQVDLLTDGMGADGVVITASTPSDEVVSTAFKMCRRKGRVVVVGDVGLKLNRADFYAKEIDFFISTSYGPGRYDARYEERGMDYPVGYVRWTENRNMSEYLRLIAEEKVRLEPLIDSVFSIDRAPEAYQRLAADKDRPLMALLSYPEEAPQNRSLARRIPNPSASPAPNGLIRIAVVGAGGFAKGVHLPALRQLSDLYSIRAVVSRTGHNAKSTATQFGATYAATDYQEVLNDSEVDAILIATRHNLHASMVLEALASGKHVFVEKPLALNRPELDKIVQHFESSSPSNGSPVLLTGFNRRFSPFAHRLRELTKNRKHPMILNYQMNAGRIPFDHWVHSEEGGGRNLGEACHIYDLFTFLIGSKATDVSTRTIRCGGEYYSHRDNFAATISFADGSLATLTYTALGSTDYPKEKLEVFVEGTVIVLDDYKKLTVAGMNNPGLSLKIADKGHRAELKAFGESIVKGGAWPIELWEQVQATEIALAVEDQLAGSVK